MEIVHTYFQKFSDSPHEASSFFSKDGELVWDKQTIRGKLEIHTFLKQIPRFKVIFSSLDCQRVSVLPCFHMIVIQGMAVISPKESKIFQSTLYTKSSDDSSTAIIISHHFVYI